MPHDPDERSTNELMSTVWDALEAIAAQIDERDGQPDSDRTDEHDGN